MPDSSTQDFQLILEQPTLAYEEGLRFFRGVGLLNETLKQLARDLEAHRIPYSVIGAVALNQHGYRRFTEDIDLLMTKEGLQKFRDELVGRGYRLAFQGATRRFEATARRDPIEVITAGEYPGDGKVKPIAFPDPAESFVEIDGIKTVPLEKLVELKLASGTTNPGRIRDLGDVQELMRIRGLDASFAERLDSSVRGAYLDLYQGLVQAQDQRLAPDREPELEN